MDPIRVPRPRVFVDSDVLFAGAASASKHGASLVILRLGELTLIDAVVSKQVVAEVERNLVEKLAGQLPAARLLVSRSLRVIPNPKAADQEAHAGRAHPKDLPILVAAAQEGCTYLVTFNQRHFRPGHHDLTVLTPGDFVLRLRELLTRLDRD
ncbi:PIN domain-containing protein [Chloroflexota bacterium]